MRRVFKGGAVLALIAILAAPALYADDAPPGTEPPSVRINPPIGVTSAAPTPEPPSVRITPPTGLMDQDFFELFWVWLQARLGPPIG